MDGMNVVRERFSMLMFKGTRVHLDTHQGKPEAAHGHMQWPWLCAIVAFCLVCIHGMIATINKNGTAMFKDINQRRLWRRVMSLGVRYGWLVLLLLGILWFPFDWLSEVWPAFGVPFREVFHNAHDHLVGHSVFFFIIGTLILYILPALRCQLHWYLLGLIMAALVQETIQAFFRDQLPTFTDFNAFKGDALGGIGAWVLWFGLGLIFAAIKKRAELKT